MIEQVCEENISLDTVWMCMLGSFVKVHQVIMNRINHVVVDGEQIRRCRIVISIHVVHKLNEIVCLILILFVFVNFNILDLGMPEWMDDNNDDDNHLNNATFEQDGTFTRSATVRQNNDSEPLKTKSQSTSDESLSQSNAVSTMKKFFSVEFVDRFFLFKGSNTTRRNNNN